MADFLELTCRIDPGQEEGLAELLSTVPVLGAQLTPAAAGAPSSVAVYLDGSMAQVAGNLRARLLRAGATDVVVRGFRSEDWLAGWRASARPFEVGRTWWIDPRPEEPTAAPAGRIRLAVEPRTAFGSGTHESTRLVLAELERLPLAGRSVLDVGTGSGILAVAAARLGAAPVVGFDIDPEAIWVARRTVAEQDVCVGALLYAGPFAALANRRFDVILCNMLTDELRPLLADIRSRLAGDGCAVLSGALEAEVEGLGAELTAVGLEIRAERRLAEWLAVRVVHADGC